jgi:iron(III) transport system substrate-binding protein
VAKHSETPLHTVSRRGFLQTSAAVAAGLAVQQRPASAQASTDELYEAAKKEGRVVWWAGTYDHPTIDALRAAFMETYPGVQLDYIWATGEVIYTRMQQNLHAGVNQVDVFCTSNAGHWPLLKNQNVLMPYQPKEEADLSAPYRNIDPDHMFRANGVEVVAINYRTDKGLTPPAKWTDLLDGKWQNQITLGSPVFSGDMVNWTIAMLDIYGEKFLTDLSKLNPKIGRSILGTGTDILSGERTVGVGLIENSTLLEKGGNPIAVRPPDDAVILAFGYMGILKDAPHPNAAKLLTEFVDSKRYSEALTKVYRFPLRDDVPSTNGFELSKLKTYKSSVERLATGTNDAIKKWNAAVGL